jgi:glycosyltransferase involved in cell wall biosynthesis
MRLGIDGSNLRAGGGVTHLVELLRAAQPFEHGFHEVFVWGGLATLRGLDERPWLRKIYDPLLDQHLPMRLYWQRVTLDRVVRRQKCDILFIPGGSHRGTFRPFVTISQNLLPFDLSEAKRYGPSWMLLRLFLLRISQKRTFRSADGVIFLTEYARDVVLKKTKNLSRKRKVIPHGLREWFYLQPRPQRDISSYSSQLPFRILYVSIVDVYKHQWHVAQAVADLKQKGHPLELALIGPAYPPALRSLRETMNRVDPSGAFIHYQGPVPHSELPVCYHGADLFVFASTCETFGQIVLEAMAAGLPIACSNRSAMPEILGDAGVYFDPEKPMEIASAIRVLIEDKKLREEKAWAAYERARGYSWERCANETFSFLAEVARGS